MERLYSTNLQVIGNHYVRAHDVLFWKYSRVDSATTIWPILIVFAEGFWGCLYLQAGIMNISIAPIFRISLTTMEVHFRFLIGSPWWQIPPKPRDQIRLCCARLAGPPLASRHVKEHLDSTGIQDVTDLSRSALRHNLWSTGWLISSQPLDPFQFCLGVGAGLLSSFTSK